MSQETNNSSSLLERFRVAKIIIKNEYIHVSGVNGSGSIFTSKKGFYDIDQFDVQNLIEALFNILTDEQKENLVKQLGDSVE